MRYVIVHILVAVLVNVRGASERVVSFGTCTHRSCTDKCACRWRVRTVGCTAPCRVCVCCRLVEYCRQRRCCLSVNYTHTSQRRRHTRRLQAQCVRAHRVRNIHAACDLFMSGVWAVFGPSTEPALSHVQSLCDAKDVPHVSAVMQRPDHQTAYSINLHVPSAGVARSLAAAIHYYKWYTLVVLYENPASEWTRAETRLAHRPDRSATRAVTIIGQDADHSHGHNRTV
jgi:hypothetical protein